MLKYSKRSTRYARKCNQIDFAPCGSACYPLSGSYFRSNRVLRALARFGFSFSRDFHKDL
ncbi:predicted protein [Sclerotinia sclerotiorum 1980 UF-70]|uniref:Uncharacterized protein n=1 Tax=Sclerotinia sclerotiorum (strain ATCC 18683 / 1980 / Ss-1) TaxID=665079 RepID=A7EM95_SCLS1|nr:predicted protein [Sclerotinia sclerotiorum 1980 UF-70]EDO03961.1 predicted protein [Sclerotinia sclerotiorum 1980 UF-70]